MSNAVEPELASVVNRLAAGFDSMTGIAYSPILIIAALLGSGSQSDGM
jgi:hypothetical protein